MQVEPPGDLNADPNGIQPNVTTSAATVTPAASSTPAAKATPDVVQSTVPTFAAVIQSETNGPSVSLGIRDRSFKARNLEERELRKNAGRLDEDERRKKKREEILEQKRRSYASHNIRENAQKLLARAGSSHEEEDLVEMFPSIEDFLKSEEINNRMKKEYDAEFGDGAWERDEL